MNLLEINIYDGIHNYLTKSITFMLH